MTKYPSLGKLPNIRIYYSKLSLFHKANISNPLINDARTRQNQRLPGKELTLEKSLLESDIFFITIYCHRSIEMAFSCAVISFHWNSNFLDEVSLDLL